MAQPHSQTQQRPTFPQQSQSFSHGYPPQPPNARPQFSPQSPQHSLSYSSPSPQAPSQTQYSPAFNNQAPPAKRARLSEEPATAYPPPVATPQAGSPVNGQINGLTPGQPRPNLMGPPQPPVIKKEDGDSAGNVFRDNTPTFGNEVPPVPSPMPTSLPPTPLAPNTTPYSPMNQMPRPIINGINAQPPPPAVDPEVALARRNERSDWEEARHSQHELWEPFLLLGGVNDKIKSIAHRSNLVEPQSGVLVNTQKNQPPPVVRVNGLEGATRVIRDGQSILDTREKADRLNELVKLISLSAKSRLTGLLQTAARIANERRQHSQGRIPDDWADIAIKAKASETEAVSSPAPNTGTKRTHDQATEDDNAQSVNGPAHAAVAAFTKSSNLEIKAEQARLAKRRKRIEIITVQENEANAAAEQEALNAVTADDGKKTTKKERRIAESRLSEQQQHASTNEAARMATANLFGKFPGSKKKSYSWLQGGGTNTPVRSASSTAAPTRATSVAPAKDRTESKKGPQLGEFDEASDLGIHARDVLLVLESDGRAAKTFVKGGCLVDAVKDSA